ncbi:16S rRNA (cytosine(1402)-N(4))-methyltransferase RsmH [Candidatus Parcubacteria bacterium]|jgi:16S rRNA (cytosine1402-N4)-methyltransferase|nr:16S rRNA (cytosine(1402)-N(4))-methyltransferase RsmH [Candidatus Parcubacteria bacterium]MBT3948561.1 16S rRNA (cytosine(1402)-N(4))-methyltransferase RsmH [Candidatus Parcubacteria bacterium]
MDRHVPVLLREVLEALNLTSGKNVIDCTLGDAGHSEEILKATGPDGRLLGIDADAESILRAKKFLYEFEDRIVFERNNFEHLQDIVKEQNFKSVNGILMDFGWSSPQFEERGRGFSFLKTDEPLDMRYDTYLKCVHTATDLPLGIDGKPLYGKCTAAEHVNMKSVEELEEVFKKYGEENLSKEIAQAIVEKREEFALETVGDLVDVILDVYRKKLKTEKEIPWIGGIHPATKVFQALRMSVNDELGVIERVLPQAINILESGGRLAVITFHSIEDRIVKHYFKSQNKKIINIITKKPIIASDQETKTNPRSRSAKLRVIEKI